MRLALGAAAAALLLAASIFAAQTLLGGSNDPKQPSPGGSARQAEPTEKAWPGGKFVVHEWGTFTSFSGSDSIKLEFRPLVDVDLPPFVLDRGRQAGWRNIFSKIDYRVLQRMETPVTYFYSDAPRQVGVKVGFPQGMLTEFFPPVENMKPEFKASELPTTGAELDWGRIWIVPESSIAVKSSDPALTGKMHEQMMKRIVPRIYSGEEHYGYARDTDSALVYVEREANQKRKNAPNGGFFEKFLFYRGVGNFELPLKMTAHTGERFELTNLGQEPIRSLFLVTVEDHQIRFSTYDEVGGGQTLTMTQSSSPKSMDELAEAVAAKLIAANLYEKEAWAMVKTWRASWFGEEGTRLFYLLPQAHTDAILPLTLDPKPDEVVRVMVGRMEIMRPEDETRVTALVKQSAEDRAKAYAARQADPQLPEYTLPESILNLGRLAEPALVRIRHLATDGTVQGEAYTLLTYLRRHRDLEAAAKIQAAQAAEPKPAPAATPPVTLDDFGFE